MYIMYILLTESPKIIDRHKLKLQEGNSISVNHFIAGRAGLQMALPVQRTELHVSAEIHHFNWPVQRTTKIHLSSDFAFSH